MFKLIKWLVFLAIIAAAFMLLTGKKIAGKSLEDYLDPILGKGTVRNAIHDVRAIVGEGLKAAGEAVSEDVTTDERQQLDNLVKQELEKGKPVEMLPGQTALPAQAQPAVQPQNQQATRPTTKQLEAMPAPAGAPAPMQALPAAPAAGSQPQALPAPAAPKAPPAGQTF